MKPIIFSMAVFPGKPEQEASLFVKSLRKFGGIYQDARVLLLAPQGMALTPSVVKTLEDLDCEFVFTAVEAEWLNFPFAAKTMLSGVAESLVDGKTSFLVWIDRDSLIIQEPKALVLPPEKIFGYRPVDHKNIGSLYDAPTDNFWQLIYEKIGVSEEMLFPIKTSIDQVVIRPYVNAGMLVVRPEAGLLRQWGTAFSDIYSDLSFVPFYNQNILYKIFIHQAVLAAVLNKYLPQAAWMELPREVNYPLHMHKNLPENQKPEDINQLITARYDTFFEDKNWQQVISLSLPFGPWLLENIHPLYNEASLQ